MRIVDIVGLYVTSDAAILDVCASKSHRVTRRLVNEVA